jgi:hypothetical protein
MGGRTFVAALGGGIGGRILVVAPADIDGARRFGTLPPDGVARGGSVIRTVSFFGPS